MKEQVKIYVEKDENGKIESDIDIQATVPMLAAVILSVVERLKSQSEEAARRLMQRVFTVYMTEDLKELMENEEKEDGKAITNKIIAKI